MPRVIASRLSGIISQYLAAGVESVSAKRLLNNFLVHIGPRKLDFEVIDKKNIFSNNYINFEDVKVVGYDLDYTLVTYTEELQHLIYNMGRENLVQLYGFPEALRSCHFDASFAIRGLSVDLKNGLLCKLSYIQRVGKQNVYRGRKALTLSEIEQVYGDSRHISQDELQTQMRPLNDLFSMAEACLIADAIHIFEHKKDFYGEMYDPLTVIDDVQSAIREVHASGSLHQSVVRDLPRYVLPSPHLPAMLQHMKQSEKELFLCTNSGFQYANRALSHVLQLPPESNEWMSIFDVIICSADKPTFYHSKKHFREWNIGARGTSVRPVTSLEPHKVYINGSVHALKRLKGWSGNSVMYVGKMTFTAACVNACAGDNMWADLVEARRSHGWLTACIIPELEKEIETQNTIEFQELYVMRSATRLLISKLQLEMEAQRKQFQRASFESQDVALIASLERELNIINVEMSEKFNPYFGSIFRTHGHASSYAFSLRRYAGS